MITPRNKAFSVSGRPVLAPNMPLVPKLPQTRVSTTLAKPTKENTLSPTARSNHHVSASMENMNTENMNTLKWRVREITNKTKEIIAYNHSSIFQDTRVIEELENMDLLFKPFFHDANYYFKSVKAAEDSGQANRFISNASLKSSSFTFMQKWREILQIYAIIRQDGMQSLVKYIQLKFRIIDSIITQIVGNDKKNIHIEKLTKTGGCLRELVISMSKSISMLIVQEDVVKTQPQLLETTSNDLRSFIQVYNEAHYKEFPKSSFMQCQLTQFKANVLTSVNDIIIALRAAFSFDNDISAIEEIISDVTEHIQSIINQLDLPPFIIKGNRYAPPPKSPTRDRGNQFRKSLDGLDEIRQFTEKVEPKGDPLGYAKLREALDKMVQKLGIELEPPEDLKEGEEEDVWLRLERITKHVQKAMKSTYEKEKEYHLFMERIRNQSKTITTMMKDQEAAEQHHKEIEDDLKAVIHDLEVRNDDLLRQRNEASALAKKRDEQLFQMRQKYDESKERKCLERVAKRMSEMIDKSEQDFDFLNDDLVARAEKMSIFIMDRRCKKCQMYEKEMKALKKSIKEIIPLKKGETFKSAMEQMIKEHKQLQDKLAQMEIDLENKTTRLKKLMAASEEIRKSSRELAFISHVGDETIDVTEDMSPDDIAKATIQAFRTMNEKHMKELGRMEEEITQKTSDRLDNVLKELTSLCGDIGDEEEEKPVDVIELFHRASVKIQEKMKAQSKELEETRSIMQSAEAWFRSHVDTSTNGMNKEETFSALMRAIDEAPNPLLKGFNEMSSERRIVKAELELFVAKLSAVVKAQRYDTRMMKIPNLLKTVRQMIDAVHDSSEAKDHLIGTLHRRLDNVQAEVVKIGLRLAAFLELPPKDHKDEEIEQSLNELSNLVETTCSKASDHFMPVAQLNEITAAARKKLRIVETSPDSYVKEIADQSVSMAATIEAVRQFEKPLTTIFQVFDFKPESFDPMVPEFAQLRDNIYKLHSIISSVLTGEIDKSVAAVISKFVSLPSSLFSAIAHINFGTGNF